MHRPTGGLGRRCGSEGLRSGQPLQVPPALGFEGARARGALFCGRGRSPTPPGERSAAAGQRPRLRIPRRRGSRPPECQGQRRRARRVSRSGARDHGSGFGGGQDFWPPRLRAGSRRRVSRSGCGPGSRFGSERGLHQPPRSSPVRPSGSDCHCGPPAASPDCRLRRGARPPARGSGLSRRAGRFHRHATPPLRGARGTRVPCSWQVSRLRHSKTRMIATIRDRDLSIFD